MPQDTETNYIILNRFLQLDDYKFNLSKLFTSGLVFEFPLPLLHLASGVEKERVSSGTGPSKAADSSKQRRMEKFLLHRSEPALQQ